MTSQEKTQEIKTRWNIVVRNTTFPSWHKQLNKYEVIFKLKDIQKQIGIEYIIVSVKYGDHKRLKNWYYGKSRQMHKK